MVDKGVTQWQTKVLRNGRQRCYVMADKDVTYIMADKDVT